MNCEDMGHEDLSLCRLSVYLSGDEINPMRISKLIGFDATEEHCKGDVWITSSSKKVVEKTGFWSFTHSVSTNDVEGELSKFLSMFSEGVSFGNLPGVTDAFLDVFVANNADEYGGGEGGITLDPQCLIRLAALELPFQVTIAVVKE